MTGHERGVPLAALFERAGGLPEHERWRLLTAATGMSKATLVALGEISAGSVATTEALLGRRLAGEPLQYIEGSVAFGPVELDIDRRALIPRPETEQLWEVAVAEATPLAPDRTIVDLCTGSGNLALALRASFPTHDVYATDVSPGAIDLARHNAAKTGLGVSFFEGDLFAPLPASLRKTVGLLVANPPYLAEDELMSLDSEVRDHEPHGALVAGPTGDEVLARIAHGAGEWLAAGAVLAIEISEFRPVEAASLFAAFDPEVRRDLAGRPRFVVGRTAADW